MLSAVFTLGVYVVGQFNADLKHFDLHRRFARRRSPSRKACYYVLPDFAKFDVKLAVVHGIPVSGGLPGVDRRPTRRSTSPRCSSARW